MHKPIQDIRCWPSPTATSLALPLLLSCRRGPTLCSLALRWPLCAHATLSTVPPSDPCAPVPPSILPPPPPLPTTPPDLSMPNLDAAPTLLVSNLPIVASTIARLPLSPAIRTCLCISTILFRFPWFPPLTVSLLPCRAAFSYLCPLDRCCYPFHLSPSPPFTSFVPCCPVPRPDPPGLSHPFFRAPTLWLATSPLGLRSLTFPSRALRCRRGVLLLLGGGWWVELPHEQPHPWWPDGEGLVLRGSPGLVPGPLFVIEVEGGRRGEWPYTYLPQICFAPIPGRGCPHGPALANSEGGSRCRAIGERHPPTHLWIAPFFNIPVKLGVSASHARAAPLHTFVDPSHVPTRSACAGFSFSPRT